jgi:hypothetical protein
MMFAYNHVACSDTAISGRSSSSTTSTEPSASQGMPFLAERSTTWMYSERIEYDPGTLLYSFGSSPASEYCFVSRNASLSVPVSPGTSPSSTRMNTSLRSPPSVMVTPDFDSASSVYAWNILGLLSYDCQCDDILVCVARSSFIARRLLPTQGSSFSFTMPRVPISCAFVA